MIPVADAGVLVAARAGIYAERESPARVLLPVIPPTLGTTTGPARMLLTPNALAVHAWMRAVLLRRAAAGQLLLISPAYPGRHDGLHHGPSSPGVPVVRPARIPYSLR